MLESEGINYQGTINIIKMHDIPACSAIQDTRSSKILNSFTAKWSQNRGQPLM